MNYNLQKAIIVLGFLALTIFFIDMVFPHNETQDLIFEETLRLIPAESMKALTRNPYRGYIEITISGYLVSADGSRTVDAFYDFSNVELLRYVDGNSLLHLNNNSVLVFDIYSGGEDIPPIFAANHVYTITYWLRTREPEFLEFTLYNHDLSSYEGELTITVRTFPNWSGR